MTSWIRISLARPNAKVPDRSTRGSVGYDLFSAEDSRVVIKPGKLALITTGVRVELPEGYEAQVRTRSGMAAKHLVVVANSPGTIDWDYRGEIKVPLLNIGERAYIVSPGDRVAQLVFARVEVPVLSIASELSTTSRGDGGFGSTGR